MKSAATPEVEDRARGFFDAYDYPDWLREHSLVVGRVASVLARAHLIADADLDEEAVIMAAFLHDIGKSPRAHDDGDHADRSAEILRAEGLGHLAEMARRHTVYAPEDPGRAPRDLAEKIVYYADRRAERRLVSLEERIAGQKARHPAYREALDRQLAAARAIEREVFAGLPFGPGDLWRAFA
ncbi:MAG TPA: HD domain-containing protein [Candidatus Limnocylindria bacterium]|nr:HD domain-containing protein [Candidatus Limnocylindria bacterium]